MAANGKDSVVEEVGSVEVGCSSLVAGTREGERRENVNGGGGGGRPTWIHGTPRGSWHTSTANARPNGGHGRDASIGSAGGARGRMTNSNASAQGSSGRPHMSDGFRSNYPSQEVYYSPDSSWFPVDPQMLKSGRRYRHSPIPPVQGGGMYPNGVRNFFTPPQEDPNGLYLNPADNYFYWRPNPYKTNGHFHPARHHRPIIPTENMPMPYGGMAPWPYFVPMQTTPCGPAPPGLMFRPGYHETAGPASVYVVPPEQLLRGLPPHMHPYYPHPLTGYSAPSPTQDADLRARILQQIEYYYSDKNLPKDDFLLELWDENGWTSISEIAKFRRIKSMKTTLPFILQSLQPSKLIEIKGDKIRRRGDWANYHQLIQKKKTAAISEKDAVT